MPTLTPTSTLVPTPLPTRTPSPTATAIPETTPTLFPGSVPALVPLGPILVLHGDRTLPYVALTFDACQSPTLRTGYDAAIIEVLNETGTPATLFLAGLWMQSHPQETRLLASNPLFELGNHSWSHPDFDSITSDEMATEVLKTQDLMYRLTGRVPTLFRFPAGKFTGEALAAVGWHGLRSVHWDASSADPVPDNDAEKMLGIVLSRVQNGSIVIMHMNGRGWHTAEALPSIIKELKAQGYVFVTVSQLLGLAPPPAPPPTATPSRADWEGEDMAQTP